MLHSIIPPSNYSHGVNRTGITEELIQFNSKHLLSILSKGYLTKATENKNSLSFLPSLFSKRKKQQGTKMRLAFLGILKVSVALDKATPEKVRLEVTAAVDNPHHSRHTPKETVTHE